MNPLKKTVLASNNGKKLAELKTLLAPFGMEIILQSELGISEADEPYPSFIENALAKARHAARASGLPALADDSGLCVDALGGAPGVHSARYAGEPRSDARNNAHLLAALAGVEDRRAHFYCVLVLVRTPEDPQPIIAEGEWHGSILEEARGQSGFGYDPLFWLENDRQTAAEMNPSRKNRLSHRAQAIARLAARLEG